MVLNRSISFVSLLEALLVSLRIELVVPAFARHSTLVGPLNTHI